MKDAIDTVVELTRNIVRSILSDKYLNALIDAKANAISRMPVRYLIGKNQIHPLVQDWEKEEIEMFDAQIKQRELQVINTFNSHPYFKYVILNTATP